MYSLSAVNHLTITCNTIVTVEPHLVDTPQRRTLAIRRTVQKVLNVYYISIDFYALKPPELRTSHYKGQHSLALHRPAKRSSTVYQSSSLQTVEYVITLVYLPNRAAWFYYNSNTL